jgi:hypothetical protein
MTHQGLPLDEHQLLTELEKGLATQPPLQIGSPVLTELADKVIRYGETDEHFLLRWVFRPLLLSSDFVQLFGLLLSVESALMIPSAVYVTQTSRILMGALTAASQRLSRQWLSMCCGASEQGSAPHTVAHAHTFSI